MCKKEKNKLSKNEVFGHFLEFGVSDGLHRNDGSPKMFFKIQLWLLHMAIVVNGLHDLVMVIIQVVRTVNVCTAFPILIVFFLAIVIQLFP